MSDVKQTAIVGGGLAGLSTAYQLLKKDPQQHIVVYERGDEKSYTADGDNSHRASLAGSSSRTMRYAGASDELGQWLVSETLAMVRRLEHDIKAHPNDYPDLQGKPLFYPAPGVTISVDKVSKKYAATLETFKKKHIPHSELTGKQLKERFPDLYKTIPDNAYALVEEPATAYKGAAGFMDTQEIMHALRHYIKAHGGEIRFGEEVSSVEEVAGKAHIVSSGGEQSFDRVVIAPGQWLPNVVDTQKHGIEMRHERVVILDIDVKALGINTPLIPFTRGDAPPGGSGSLYSFYPDSTQGHIKFLPKATTSKVESLEQLQAPISEQEKQLGLESAAARLGISAETLKPHVQFSVCAYTYPKKEKYQLVSKLSDHIVVNGLDSSSTARKVGGLGAIAANLALGIEEPLKGAYDRFSLEAHHRAVTAPDVVPKEPSGFRAKLGKLWHRFLEMVGFETVAQPQATIPVITPTIQAANTSFTTAETSLSETTARFTEKYQKRDLAAKGEAASPEIRQL
ncbi:MAG: FAD-dependent oxidoreductase [Rickettsiales bacterium]|nr:FAD-dependent oxidoreductase [Rickettsiales bacterium]